MTLTETGRTFGLRQMLPQLLGGVAGFAIQTLAQGAGLGMILSRWPALHGALQGLAVLGALYVGWQLLRGRGAAAAGSAPVPFWEAAARQFLNPWAWLIAAAVVMLGLPLALDPILTAGYTGAI